MQDRRRVILFVAPANAFAQVSGGMAVVWTMWNRRVAAGRVPAADGMSMPR